MKIALIAHDKKKNEIIELAIKYKDVLASHELYATGTTGTLIMGETAINVLTMPILSPTVSVRYIIINAVSSAYTQLPATSPVP